ncbi:MAG: FkbM family methyltransferase [Archangium sp.]|nr:FkbM family methyltransferase [Archangium sp.]MDP3151040.1 FkbM family methyltransferase [Archangium sp.]MDP3569787.1 FkbM family methyltransferase [Archangium sp.]
MTLRAESYRRYKHALRGAYNSLSLFQDVDDESMAFVSAGELEGKSALEVLAIMEGPIRKRLQRVGPSLLGKFLEKPRTRELFFNNQKLTIPVLNEQAVEWYETSDVFNFDCVLETFLGLHHGARTIYDLGGHQGLWAAYYAGLCGEGGRVYSFEPSIINFESSCLLFLMNDLVNVINVPFGVGDKPGLVRNVDSGGILVDFVEHNLGILRFDQVFFEPPDFIKIDIEGFEHELLASFPNLFKFCRNMHLELHIPHLERRGVDYLETFRRIPFESVRVRNYQYGQLTEVGPNDKLSGYCSLMITPR